MRPSTAAGASHNSSQRQAAPILGRRWWVPSAFASLAVLLLLVVPAVVDLRITKVRGGFVLAAEQARVLLNDLEASFASELLVRNSAVPPNEVPRFASPVQLEEDRAGLRSVVADLGTEAVARYGDLDNRLQAWDASAHDGTSATTQDGLELLTAAERLDSLLTVITAARRDEVLRLEHIDFITPLILAPIALVAIIIVMWGASRTLRFAQLADEERLQVVRAGEARSALLRGVTHDVKNPLGAATGYAQLLEEGIVGPLAPQQLEMVHRIHRLVHTSVQTIADLLELARADGELHIEYATCDLGTIVWETADDHRGMAQEHGVELTVTAPKTPMVTDPTRVRQILANLISNAIKYTPSGGQVHVEVVGQGPPGHDAHGPGTIGVAVRDTGPGIPAELRDKVFEEFFRVRNAGMGPSDGNGLGLAISRRIARLLGGDVTLDDRAGGGAIFTLWFRSSHPESVS